MKKVAKLGGMMGDCNMCLGKGSILLADKPKPVIVEPVSPVNDVIKAVENVAPIESLSVKEKFKTDGKKALYRRKKTA